MNENKNCEVRFYHRGILISSQAIKLELLKKGFLDFLAEEFSSMPMFRGKLLNVQIKPIKKNVLDLDFQNNNNILLEV